MSKKYKRRDSSLADESIFVLNIVAIPYLSLCILNYSTPTIWRSLLCAATSACRRVTPRTEFVLLKNSIEEVGARLVLQARMGAVRGNMPAFLVPFWGPVGYPAKGRVEKAPHGEASVAVSDTLGTGKAAQRFPSVLGLHGEVYRSSNEELGEIMPTDR